MFSSTIATRREFVARGLGVLGVGAAIPNFLVRTALAGPQAKSGEPILVVLQLTGGHDGLSAVVPYASDDYGRARTATRIAADEVVRIDDQVGLHPSLAGFGDLIEKGQLAVVQGVGYPNPNRSHFLSMDIWHLADNEARTNSSQTETSFGWIGKYVDQAFRGMADPKLALAVGSGVAPLAIRGKEHPGLCFSSPSSYRYIGDRGEKSRAELYDQLQETEMGKLSNVDFVTQTALNANASSQAIRELASAHKPAVTYPSSSLASALRTVAGLIAGGLSTRVYYVFQGSYDTHAGQRTRHDKLMTDLNDAVVAFQCDLAAQKNDQRVLTVSFSEFGRRVKENFSEGTDHGVAGPMFLVGPGVKAGLHGKLPSLKEDDLVQGDLVHNVDFRSVYATLLDQWLGVASQPILGDSFAPLDCLA